MSCMRYMLTLEIPSAPDQGNFKFSKKLKSKFTNYDQFVEEIKQMIDSGELRRMVEGMTEHHGGEEQMREKWNEGIRSQNE